MYLEHAELWPQRIKYVQLAYLLNYNQLIEHI